MIVDNIQFKPGGIGGNLNGGGADIHETDLRLLEIPGFDVIFQFVDLGRSSSMVEVPADYTRKTMVMAATILSSGRRKSHCAKIKGIGRLSKELRVS